MAGSVEVLASIKALMLDPFATYNMTGWVPRLGSDEYNTLRLLRRDGRFFLTVTVTNNDPRKLADIALDDVISYVIRVPTWHEVKLADTSMIALHLSKASDFDKFYDLLVSLLKIHKKYDRLTDRVGADQQTFLDEVKIVRVRMQQMSLGVPLTGDLRCPPKNHSPADPEMSFPPPPSLQQMSVGGDSTRYRRPQKNLSPVDREMSFPPPPPLPPRGTKASTFPPQQSPASKSQMQIQAKRRVSIPLSEQMDLESDSEDDEYYTIVQTDKRLPPWVCPRCTLANESEVYQCNACERPRSDAWQCRRCANIHHIDIHLCIICKALRCRHCEYHNDPGTARCNMCNSNL